MLKKFYCQEDHQLYTEELEERIEKAGDVLLELRDVASKNKINLDSLYDDLSIILDILDI